MGSGLPSRVILPGVEGIGKTSIACYAPKPIFLMAEGETGLETLIDSGRVPQTPHFPELHCWEDTFSALDQLLTAKHEYKTLVLDTLNGFERLCHEYTCKTMYGGKWGKDGFTSYQQGYDTALAFWREFLAKLDELRRKCGMLVLALTHVKVSPFRNPEGADYDRYQPDLHHKTWSLCHKWADMVLFANYYTVVDEDGPRAKAAGGKIRRLWTERTAAYDAKNRHGLPEYISMGTSGQEAWDNLVTAIKTAKGS